MIRIRLTPVSGRYCGWGKVLVRNDDRRGRRWVVMHVRLMRRREVVGWRELLPVDLLLTKDRRLGGNRLIIKTVP